MSEKTALRPMPELSSSGMLWLINRQVFHPRGIALVLEVDSEVPRWGLTGDGSEVWRFEEALDDAYYLKANATLMSHLGLRAATEVTS